MKTYTIKGWALVDDNGEIHWRDYVGNTDECAGLYLWKHKAGAVDANGSGEKVVRVKLTVEVEE